MTRTKICGLRRLDDVLLAARLGADYCGFVFVPGRSRRLEVAEAVDLIGAFRKAWNRSTPTLVGLFADQPLDEVRATLQAVGLDAAQLCGGETWEYADALGTRVLKVLHVDGTKSREQVQAEARAHLAACRAHGATGILDAFVPGVQGGSGKAFDWSTVAGLAAEHGFLLAGGLTPENVARAIGKVRPWGVDVSSGVETRDAKDPRKIEAFIAAVRAADRRRAGATV